MDPWESMFEILQEDKCFKAFGKKNGIFNFLLDIVGTYFLVQFPTLTYSFNALHDSIEDVFTHFSHKTDSVIFSSDLLLQFSKTNS